MTDETDNGEYWMEGDNIPFSHIYEEVNIMDDLDDHHDTTDHQYENLVTQLKARDKQLEKMRQVCESLRHSYSQLEEKCQIEMSCRQRAERYASQVTQNNKQLKRQSQMLTGRTRTILPNQTQEQDEFEDENNCEDENADYDVIKDEVGDDDLQRQYLDSLNDKIDTLVEQKRELQGELEELKEDYQSEKDKRTMLSAQNTNLKGELMQTRQALQQHKEALERLASASETAYQEFEELKGSYSKEIVCRDKAEKYAATLFAEREAARRQSSMLLMNVAGDRKLMEAMMEVETLTTRVEEQRVLYERQIQELQEEVQGLRESEAMETMEEENSKLAGQVVALQAQIMAQHTQYNALLQQYEIIEEKLEEAMRPPPPPPPPPPPSKKLSRLFGGKKSKKEILLQAADKKEDKMNQNYSQALDEMMKRIRVGSPLKPSPRLPPPQPVSTPDSCTAMTELKGLLSKMKKPGNNSNTPSSSSSSAKDNCELLKTFRKIRKPSPEDPLTSIIDGSNQGDSNPSPAKTANMMPPPQDQGTDSQTAETAVSRPTPHKPRPKPRSSRLLVAVPEDSQPIDRDSHVYECPQ